MERLTGKQVQTMMEALHQVYAQPEEQVENLQEEVEQLDEQGRPSGPARRAALQQRTADAAAVKSAELKAGGGQAAVDNALKARYGGRMPSQRQLARHSSGASATRSVTATGRENLYRGGGGDAAMAKGLTRQQVMAQGAKNFAAKQTTSAPTKPAAPTKPVAGGDTKPTTPAGATMPDKKPAVPTGTVNGQKFERRLPTMAELRAAQAARAAAKASGGDRAAQEKAAIKAGVDAGKPAPKLAVGAKPGTTTSYSGSTAAKPVGTAVQSGVKPVAGAPTASAAGTKFGVQRPAAATTPAAKPAVPTNNTATAFKSGTNLAPGAAKPGTAPDAATVDRQGNRAADLFTGKPNPAYNKPVPKTSTAPVKRDADGTPMGQKRKEPLWNSVDLFDIVRGELLDEGYSEQDAMYIMANLDDEQREIVMNEGIGALLKGALKISGKLFSRFAKKPGGKSEIAKRASKVVKDQRAGVMGTADDLNQLQQTSQQTIDKLKSLKPSLSRRSANLNAKTLESQVRRAANYGPSQYPPAGFTSGRRIDPPKPTGSKPGVVKLDKYGNPIK